jgi:hypothetical protein
MKGLLGIGLFAVVARIGCSLGRDATQVGVDTESLTRRAVGDACTASDFPPILNSPLAISTEEKAALDRGEPIVFTVPAGFTDRTQLPFGQLYCIEGSRESEYPAGYVTANCHVDGECGSGNLCDGGVCRRPCSSDAECKAPSTCPTLDAFPTPPRFCRCLDCIKIGERE